MNSLLRRCLWAAALFGAAGPLVFALTPEQPGDQKITVIRTSNPTLRPSIGEKLPAGQVTVLIQVDGAGALMDTLIVSYTHPYYAEAVVKALKEWHYKPALKGGEPVVARSQLVFHFDVTQQVLDFTRGEVAEALWANAAGTRDVQCVFRAKDLSGSPQAVTVVQPQRIAPPGQPVPAGRVLIDFFIDERGMPRMPAVMSYDDERMAGSALQAIAQWRFTPPVNKGRNVAVHAQQWFEFPAGK